MTDYKVLRSSGDHPSEFCDISNYCGFWANDMVTSASGDSYVGNFGFDLHAMLRDVGAVGMFGESSTRDLVVVISPEGDVLQVGTRYGLSQRDGHHPRRHHADRGRDALVSLQRL